MLDIQLCPSMMCVDPMKLAEVLKVFEKNDIEYLHIDVMDGHFVPNFSLSADYCRMLHENTSIPLDIHLMVEAPEDKLSWFDIRPGDSVSVHSEATHHLQRALDRIREAGAQPVVALNPATPLSMAEEVFSSVSAILIMTVSPGYAGQQLVGSTIDKIRRLRTLLNDSGHETVRIQVDGNVSFSNMQKMRQAGADTFVIGSSGFLRSNICQEIHREICHFRKI